MPLRRAPCSRPHRTSTTERYVHRRDHHLALYYEDRACKAPTAARVLELLDPLARTVILHQRKLLALQEPTLNPLQTQTLTLLGVPTDPYGRHDQPGNSS